MVVPMRIIFRTDASIEIGTGHVMRCLTLASGLAKRGAAVRFLCRAHDANLIELIELRGFVVHALPAMNQRDLSVEIHDAPAHAAWLGCDWQVDVEQCSKILTDSVDCIIVDHYALDHRWETAMRTKCNYIMVIDDLADRIHDCDLLLDQNLGRKIEDYRTFVSSETRMLLGPSYALLRPEFAEWRNTSLSCRQDPKLRHLLVTMGGIDKDNITGRVLKTLIKCRLATLERITVVLGDNAPWIDSVRELAADMQVPTTVLSGADNIAELMTSCDLAIGACGTTTWERCTLGLPSVLIVLASNQLNIAMQMSRSNAAFVIYDLSKLEASLVTFLESSTLSRKMEVFSHTSAEMLDANGVAKIVSELFSNYEK